MQPLLNQPGRLYATAKTHKSEKLDEIFIDELKFSSIIDQTGPHICCSKSDRRVHKTIS